ncbi:gamma-glutamylcyclotransferase family protein [Pseudooceanicola sp. LIPI14-2-Ac024]|uniref:gamma-glutamylcyclotransferase family protein n=1 Tax=Pseudooceanicola sp. LIPI14-2-Ac024 TaxID=3344875 RepID=UPI0035D05D35
MDPYFFGYGSLVNRMTHDYPDARPALARGWRRVWRHIEGRDHAVLTAVPHADSEIEGLVAAVPAADWRQLDLREGAYDRVDGSGHVAHDIGEVELAIYWIPENKHILSDATRPVLLSYLDVCVQGYLREFGEAGVERFFATTDGWGTVRDDRAAPAYPRHQRLEPVEMELVDQHLSRMGIARV